MSFSTISIIYNPNSTGQSDAIAKKFKKQLHAQLKDIPIQLEPTEYAGHAEELAYSRAKKSPHALIISSSGDGGYHEVINGVLRAQAEGAIVTTGLLPAGNANDHYHTMHKENVVERIIEQKIDHIDILTLQGRVKGQKFERYAHSYIGFGLTPAIGKELNKVSLNKFKETLIVARSLFRIKPIRLRINNKVRSYESIIMSNVDLMSKYLKISQPSSMSDGKFEVTIFRRRNKIKLIMTLLQASLSGVKENQQSTIYRLSTIKHTDVQLDGEIFKLDPKTEVTIGIEKQALGCII